MLKKIMMVTLFGVFAAAKAYCTELYICNESNYSMRTAIVYKYSFGMLSDNFNTAGYYTIAPGDCKTIKYGLSGVMGTGYLTFSFLKNGNYVTPSYQSRRSSRRSAEPLIIDTEDRNLCLPGSSLGYSISTRDLQNCTLEKVRFNLYYRHESSVDEWTVYVSDTGVQTSYKSSSTR